MKRVPTLVQDFGDDIYLIGPGLTIQDPTQNPTAMEVQTLLGRAAESTEMVLKGPFGFSTKPSIGQIATDKAGNVIKVAGFSDDILVVEVGFKPDERDIAVLHIDENGVLNWVIDIDASTSPTEIDLGKTNGFRKFSVPIHREEAKLGAGGNTPDFLQEEFDSDSQDVGTQVIFILTILTEFIPASAVVSEIRKWEAKNHPYELVTFPFQERVTRMTKFEPGNWLVFIHGTFSSSHGGFGDLLSETTEALKKTYGEKIIGLNHPTLTEDPWDNMGRLYIELNSLRPRKHKLSEYTFDFVAHSRGGLVAREFCTHTHMKVRKAILVAAPNTGTQLAEPGRIDQFVSNYSNVAKELPANAATAIMTNVFLVLKALHKGAIDKLPGLGAMNPKGTFIQNLGNLDHRGAEFYGIASDFRPDIPPNSKGMRNLEAIVRSGVFKGGNDLVVPYNGAFTIGSTMMGRILMANRNIHHTKFFKDDEVNQKLKDWLA